MEYVAGGTLRRVLEAGRPPDPSAVVATITQVAGALQALHEARILPRSFQTSGDQRLLATILLDTLGADPGEVLGKLDAFLLSPGDNLMSHIEALDMRLRDIVAGRRQMREYVSQAESIQQVWGAAERALRTAWASDMLKAGEAERKLDAAQAALAERRAALTAANDSEALASAETDAAGSATSR
jgi:hypothetical protein